MSTSFSNSNIDLSASYDFGLSKNSYSIYGQQYAFELALGYRFNLKQVTKQ